MDKFTTQSKAAHFAIIEEPIIIDETKGTRRVFVGTINDKRTTEQETVNGTIIHQRKNIKDDWEPVETINLATLKGGEGVKIHFDSKQLRRFYLGLQKLYTLSGEGVHPGRTKFAVGLADEIIKVPKERMKFINQLLSEDHGEEIWQQLVEKNPDLATRLSFARLHSQRCQAIKEFEQSINMEKSEDYWQTFFSNNEWIFGYGLKYHFLTQLTEQPHYGGTNFTGKGAQKGDYLMSTQAEIKFTVLVELKKSKTNIIAHDKKGEKIRYRNGAYLLSSELLGGISQMQINCRTWQRRSSDPENSDSLLSQNIYTVNPKGILVIGNTKELKNREEIETFETFRNNISNPAIITFDELLERAKFIVDQSNPPEQSEEDGIVDKNDLPF